ncbi:MAG: hypothetical protein ACRDYZ_03400 [Acidimicrobiales bacterium]
MPGVQRVVNPVDLDRSIEPVRDPDLDRALDPYRSITLRVRCGVCRRIMAEARPFPRYPTIWVNRSFRLRDGISRPAMSAESVDGLELVEGGTWRFTCVSRCSGRNPRSWVVSNRDLVLAFIVVARAGGTELVFGENV